jgi:LPXTG-motif cell wall-anchored protein
MPTRLTLLALAAAVLALPAPASAGGWATVGFDPPPKTLTPGEPWTVELTVLQHGVTPLEGVRPVVIVRREGQTRAKSEYFPAKPTGRPGVYRTTVVFGSAGTWRYVVDDGFTARHNYPPVRVGEEGTEYVGVAKAAATAPPATGDDGPDFLLALGVAGLAALGAGGAAALLQRRRGGAGPAAG